VTKTLFISFFVLCCAATARAQAPFYVDDVEVAARHKWHFEFNNEFDVLRDTAFPNLRQNDANFKASWGLAKNIEVGFDNQLLLIQNAPHPQLPRTAFGYGDMDFSVKWHFLDARDHPWRPALAASMSVELPTGDSRRQLGSGIADFYLNFIGQQSLPRHNTLRGNIGYYFAGNTQTGVVGLENHSGHVLTGGMSFTHDLSERLDLGAELYGAMSGTDLGRGQLQSQFGGNYKLHKNLQLDFGLVTGYYQSSPRVAPIIGFEIDFQ